MKVLKNLFGNNTKISASEIAIKGSNEKAKTLDNYLSVGFAKMQTNFESKEFTSSGGAYVTGWSSLISYGDITSEPNNNRIVVKKTKMVEISGGIAGNSNAGVRLELKDENDVDITEGNANWLVFQPGGNGYWSSPLKNLILELDPDKTYYLRLYASGYNGKTFNMNSGFEASGTYIQAKKLL